MVDLLKTSLYTKAMFTLASVKCFGFSFTLFSLGTNNLAEKRKKVTVGDFMSFLNLHTRLQSESWFAEEFLQEVSPQTALYDLMG